MHHTEEDFLEALRQSPQDDDLRLVFSDWLEDQDDGRAGFLRLQVQRRHRGAGADLGDILRQQDELLRKSRSGWLAPLKEYNAFVSRGNGLLGVVMTAEQLVEVTAADLEAPAWHWVDELRLFKVDFEAVTELLAAPALAHFREIDLSQLNWGQDLSPLIEPLAATHLDRLTELNLECSKLTHDAGRQLAGAVWLRQLRRLNLGQNNLGNVAIRDLVLYGTFDRLRVLELRSCDLGPMAVESLVNAAFFSRLQALGLSKNKIRNEGARILLQSPHLKELRALDLSENGITTGIAKQLKRACPGLVL
jgi:uncharacterized protein (TIGR02996 family)